MSFRDRSEAGRRLAAKLQRYVGEDAVVFALPRGGVPVALEIAKALHAPLDLVLVRKLGVPYQRELAMGAVADGGHAVVVRNQAVIERSGVSEADFDEARRRELAEIERRRAVYFQLCRSSRSERAHRDHSGRWRRRRRHHPRRAALGARAGPEVAGARDARGAAGSARGAARRGG